MENALTVALAALAGLGLGLWLGRRGSDPQAFSQAIDSLRQQEGALRERAARAEQAAEEARRQLAEEQPRLDRLRAELAAEAARLFKEQSSELREEAGRRLEAAVGPLRQNLEDFKGLANRLHSEDLSSRSGLAEQVRALSEQHQRFAQRAEELSRSLSGNAQGQGKWGEMVLERVLEMSGLRRDHEYVVQGEGLGLKAEGGSHQKPDAVILLPEGKQLLVDAKAPLDGYLAAQSAPDAAAKEAGIAALVKALRAQVAELSKRSYHLNEKLVTPEFTLMFVPIEGALSAALQAAPGLMEEAWNKRVVLVGPNMLFGTLKVVGQIWAQEKRSQNAEEIARRGGLLYDKLALFVQDLAEARKAMKQALERQEAAHRKLGEGPGNLLSQAEKMKELGARASKELPLPRGEGGAEPTQG